MPVTLGRGCPGGRPGPVAGCRGRAGRVRSLHSDHFSGETACPGPVLPVTTRRCPPFSLERRCFPGESEGCRGPRTPRKDTAMTHSTLLTLLLTTPFAAPLLPLAQRLLPHLQQITQLLEDFRAQPVTPAATRAFELRPQELPPQAGP